MTRFRCFSKNWDYPMYILANSRWEAMNTYEILTGYRCYSAMRLRN